MCRRTIKFKKDFLFRRSKTAETRGVVWHGSPISWWLGWEISWLHSEARVNSWRNLSADTYAISTADRRERPWAAKDPARDHRSEDECAEHPSLGWIIHIHFSKFTFGGSGSAAGKLIFGSGRGNLHGRKMNVWCQVQELWLSLQLSWTKMSGRLTRSSLCVLIKENAF